MRIDLEQALADVARSVHDDGTPDRMTGQVRTMVTRVRRRRAARRGAVGAVGIGAAVVVVVGGLQLAGLGPDDPPPPAAPTPTLRTGADACGLTLDEAGWVQRGPVGLGLYDGGPTVRQDGGVDVATWLDETDVELVLEGTPATQYVVVDPSTGRVVGVPRDGGRWEPDWAAVTELVGPEAAQRMMSSAGFTVDDCGADPAAPGADGALDPQGLELHGVIPLRPADPSGSAEALVAVGGPWTILPTDGEELTSEMHDALVTLSEWVSQPVPNPDGVFPRCGTLAEVLPEDPPLALDLDVDVLEVESGGTLTHTVDLRTTEGRYVIGNASAAGATLVLLREGVVVGYQWLDAEDVVDVDLRPGDSRSFELRGDGLVCGTGEGGQGPPLPLPPGEYEAVAALDVLLKEVGTPGGSAESVTELLPAASEPITVVVR